ncbi:hypothetical protein RFI_38154 [Reticulomyxa filosa]|uniref:Mannosyltransferase n=1 Tax=Reticulomyxa filosa TaxID=46433 RepID=X6LCQ9_RETFI|nr:hypothetical protein RFI_38154 [Reticulomyxa filosa]|eukprot:ETN99328.1 hypothetical protein RFI_38154 [Reticulomyxa filosa]
MVQHVLLYSMLGILATVIVDTMLWKKTSNTMWDSLTWPELKVLLFNTKDNRSHEWGTQPFYWYFTSAIPKMLMANCLFFWLAIFRHHPLYFLNTIKLFFLLVTMFDFTVVFLKKKKKKSLLGERVYQSFKSTAAWNIRWMKNWIKKNEVWEMTKSMWTTRSGSSNSNPSNGGGGGGLEGHKGHHHHLNSSSSASSWTHSTVPFAIYLDWKSMELLIISAIFVLLYSFLPHKEVRFIFFIIPAMTACSCIGCLRLWNVFRYDVSSVVSYRTLHQWWQHYCVDTPTSDSIVGKSKKSAVITQWLASLADANVHSSNTCDTMLSLLNPYVLDYLKDSHSSSSSQQHKTKSTWNKVDELWLNTLNDHQLLDWRWNEEETLSEQSKTKQSGVASYLCNGYLRIKLLRLCIVVAIFSSCALSFTFVWNVQHYNYAGGIAIRNIAHYMKSKQSLYPTYDMYCIHICDKAAQEGVTRFMTPELGGDVYFDKKEHLKENDFQFYANPCGESFKAKLRELCTSADGKCWHYNKNSNSCEYNDRVGFDYLIAETQNISGYKLLDELKYAIIQGVSKVTWMPVPSSVLRPQLYILQRKGLQLV